MRRAPRDLELDELVSAGTLGLVQALEGFEPGARLAFSTYAMPRIRGAMLDEMRAQDWVPRSVRARAASCSPACARPAAPAGPRPGRRPRWPRALGVDEPTLLALGRARPTAACCWRSTRPADAGEEGGRAALRDHRRRRGGGPRRGDRRARRRWRRLHEAFAALPGEGPAGAVALPLREPRAEADRRGPARHRVAGLADPHAGAASACARPSRPQRRRADEAQDVDGGARHGRC